MRGTPSAGRLRLFRGLAVPLDCAEVVETDIEENGLSANRGNWRMIWDPPGEDAGPDEVESLAVCACADFDSAAYYACKHNRSGVNDTPLVVEFAADSMKVAVDGRDFLYTVFQFGNGALARDIVEQAFGSRALLYLDEAWRTTDQPRRIELCRKARHDPEVVRAHCANRLVLGGRYSTRFRSAFLVKAPVAPALVTGIHRPPKTWTASAPDAELGCVLGRAP